MITNSSVPVYSLGGMRASDLATAMSYGAHGIASLSAVWSDDQCERLDASVCLVDIVVLRAGNRIAFGRPGSEIDQLAALGTKRTELFLLVPFDLAATSRTSDLGHLKLERAECQLERHVLVH